MPMNHAKRKGASSEVKAIKTLTAEIGQVVSVVDRNPLAEHITSDKPGLEKRSNDCPLIHPCCSNNTAKGYVHALFLKDVLGNMKGVHAAIARTDALIVLFGKSRWPMRHLVLLEKCPTDNI